MIETMNQSLKERRFRTKRGSNLNILAVGLPLGMIKRLKTEVIDDTKNNKFINIIRKFNTHIKKDIRIVKNIIPIGDGLTVCIKK